MGSCVTAQLFSALPANDVELTGRRIPGGTLVLANTAAANRDPDVYDCPDRLDITREDPPVMLTSAAGCQRISWIALRAQLH